MARSMLNGDRVDRYELEVFVKDVNISVNPQTLDKIPEEETRFSKYTVKMVLTNLIDAEICNYEKPKDTIPTFCQNRLKWTDSERSFANTIEKLDDQYFVDHENPVCVGNSLCYNITAKPTDKNYDVFNKSPINKGVVSILASMPRTLIKNLMRYPLELTVFKDLEGGGRTMLGGVSIKLTECFEAIASHFYEKGYESHTHLAETVYEVKSATDDTVVVGNMTVRVKFTCHGPETTSVEQMLMKPNRPALQPVSVNVNDFDFPFDRPVVRQRPKMMYYRDDDPDGRQPNGIEALNPEIDELLRSQRTRQRTADKPKCMCQCKALLENIKRILSDGRRNVADDMEPEPRQGDPTRNDREDSGETTRTATDAVNDDVEIFNRHCDLGCCVLKRL